MPRAFERGQARAARIRRFQAEIDALPDAGTKGVIENIGSNCTIEYRGNKIGWEVKAGQGHVGLFGNAGEAMNAAWELSPWELQK